MRCLTLADRLAGLGWTPRFHVDDATPLAVPALLRSGFALRAEMAAPDPATRWLAFDRYDWAAPQESQHRSAIADAGSLVIDDLADRSHDCDVLVDATPSRTPHAYWEAVPRAARILAGSRYALLRPQFQAMRQASLVRRMVGRIERIVIALGASDAGGHSLPWLKATAAAFPDAAIDVVLGAAASSRMAIAEEVRSLKGRARLHIDIDEMASLLAECDLAIGAGGTSALERCCLGLPTVLVVTAENQRANAEALADAGAVVVAQDDPAGVLASLTPDRLAEMAAAAAGLVDGRGAARVAMALAGEAVTKKGAPVGLRLVEEADAALLLEWQRAPETRRFARNPVVPSPAEHKAWVERRLADPGSWLCLVMSGSEPVASVRLDRLEGAGTGFEVSIYVAPGQHGRGFGLAALGLLRNLAPGARLLATVLEGNLASQNLFAAAGYRRISPDVFELAPAA